MGIEQKYPRMVKMADGTKKLVQSPDEHQVLEGEQKPGESWEDITGQPVKDTDDEADLGDDVEDDGPAVSTRKGARKK